VSDLQPRDSHVTDPAELRRLTGQSAAILARLQRGPATARELSALSLKYTSRISDLRKAGYDVRCREDAETGVSTYTLDVPASEPGQTQGHNTNAPSEGRLW
jgi:hypothetical protein